MKGMKIINDRFTKGIIVLPKVLYQRYFTKGTIVSHKHTIEYELGLV